MKLLLKITGLIITVAILCSCNQYVDSNANNSIDSINNSTLQTKSINQSNNDFSKSNIEPELTSIPLETEQKAVIDKLYNEYSKMALLFFNTNYEVKDALDIFKGTEYECIRTLSCDENINDSGFNENFGRYSGNIPLIRYTGSVVNTLEKFHTARSLYFTDRYVSQWDFANDIILYRWEENYSVYQTSSSGGMTIPLGDSPDIYIKEYREIKSKHQIKIKVLTVRNGGEKPVYDYQNITLETTDDGIFKLDVMTDADEINELPPKFLYEKGTVHLNN